MDRAILKGAPQGTKRTKVIFVYLVAVRNELISHVLALVAPGSFYGVEGMCRSFCVGVVCIKMVPIVLSNC